MFRNKQSKNKALFQNWVDLHSDGLYKHALWMTGNRDTALDMVQETFYQAWQCINSLKDQDKSFPWLLMILRRSVYKEQKSQYRHVETVTHLSQCEDNITENDSSHLLEIYTMLGELSSTHRDVFLLFHLHGFSYDEISEQLSVPVGTVMSRISRARQALKKLTELSENNVSNIQQINAGES